MVSERVPEPSDYKSPPRRSLEREQLGENKEPIGSGGQGAVYRVDLSENMPIDQVAIKEPIADSETIPVGDVQTFLEEAKTWQTVDQREREKQRWEDSEHIVGVIDTGDSLPWIAMEYMDGGGLDDRLESNPNGLSVDEALWIGECICRGVELAHSYGIAHLDLKPANILFRETNASQWDVPKIADWGLARVLAKQSGTMEGISVRYAAPEQFEPEEFGEPDMLTDVYQVGAIVYAMLTGEPLYTGNQLSVVHDVVYGDDPAAPSEIRNDLSSDIDKVVSRAIATRKENRYQTIKRFERELQSIRVDGSSTAKGSTVEAEQSESSENESGHTVSSTNTSGKTADDLRSPSKRQKQDQASDNSKTSSVPDRISQDEAVANGNAPFTDDAYRYDADRYPENSSDSECNKDNENEVESANYSNRDSKVEPDKNSKTTTDHVTASSEGDHFSIELVALSRGRELNHYLTKDISEVETSMSLSGKKTFEERVVAFAQVTNTGDKVDAYSDDYIFESSDGYQYSSAEDTVTGVTSVYFENKWKSAHWEISHGQTQYWAIISEPIPSNIDLQRLIYNKKGEEMEIEFGHIRNRLYEQDPTDFIL